MPTLNHSSMADYANVYEPSDDTYLLIDAIKYDFKIASRLQQLKRLERIETVMEIGTGSGVPITYISKRLLMEKPLSTHSAENDDNDDSNHGFSMIATDLNPLALKFAERTAKENGIFVGNTKCGDDTDGDDQNAKVRAMEFVECDLASPLLDRLGGGVDVLIFNPPYVPTEDSEISGSGIEISWAGGQDGRRVIDRALPQIARLLRQPDGVCYMITVDDNLPCELASKLRDEHRLQMVPLMRRRAFNEYLSVQKISWL
eukprot:jgi/Psemu1/238404/estExt_Genewise1.C_990012